MSIGRYAVLIGIYWVIAMAMYAEMPRQMGAGKAQATSRSAPYALHIVAYYQEGKHTIIALDNGSNWRLQSPSLWLVGDSVYLVSDPKGGWRVYNNSDRSNNAAEFVEITSRNAMYIRAISNFGGEITLSDGSTWRVGWWRRLWGRGWEWKVGDRILVAPLRFSFQDRNYLLINVSRFSSHVEADLLYR